MAEPKKNKVDTASEGSFPAGDPPPNTPNVTIPPPEGPLDVATPAPTPTEIHEHPSSDPASRSVGES
jgi:hypothetical protein